MMKRLVFCFDGSWNRIDAPHPTNVLFTAESVLPLAGETAQLIYYDEGVGTEQGEKFRGGMFGRGIEKNLNDAYRFLVFNHTPGDEIYIFGFSRGAFTARSFAGLIANSGILARSRVGFVNQMMQSYRSRPNPVTAEFRLAMMRYRAENCPDVCISEAEDEWRAAQPDGKYRKGQSPLLSIRYVGIWDTVGALGVPGYVLGASLANREYQFHDCDLSPFIQSARHAVSIDERKQDFSPTLWENLPELNRARGSKPDVPDAPYQQVWFPGNHGSTGGGGDVRGLADQALEWIWEGARAAGLRFDTAPGSMLYSLKPDDREPLVNSTSKAKWYDPVNFIIGRLPVADRSPGPDQLHQVSLSARRRWHRPAGELPEKAAYRPKTLTLVADVLDRLDAAELGIGVAPPVNLIAWHTVERDETLGALAVKYYHDAANWTHIFDANRDVLHHPDKVFVGQLLRIPAISPA